MNEAVSEAVNDTVSAGVRDSEAGTLGIKDASTDGCSVDADASVDADPEIDAVALANADLEGERVCDLLILPVRVLDALALPERIAVAVMAEERDSEAVKDAAMPCVRDAVRSEESARVRVADIDELGMRDVDTVLLSDDDEPSLAVAVVEADEEPVVLPVAATARDRVAVTDTDG